MRAEQRKLRLAGIVAALVLSAGCSGGNDGNGLDTGSLQCGEAARKQFVLSTSRDWYLFPELLPAAVDPADFATAEELLDHLTATAREQGKDRYFSYLTTRDEDDSILGEGQYVGFGFRTGGDAVERPFVVDVFEASPAAAGGLRRGDEIIAVDAGSGYVPVSDLIADGGSISDAFGPAEIGVRRGLRLANDGLEREVTLTKTVVTIDPVPDAFGVQVLPLPGTTGVGYLNFRTYVSTARDQLRAAFGSFRNQGIDYFIVDLRYNGGGLVATAELINDLLGGARSTSDVQTRTVHNSARSALDTTRFFLPESRSVRPVRIAFLTSGATASASEININAMAPWVEVAIVGDDTLGKPVGQLAFDLAGCSDRLRLVSFQTENAEGRSDYYDGLASTLDFACAAEDTLDRQMGDPDEGLTSAALEWLGTGRCERIIAPGAARAKPGLGPDAAAQPAQRRRSAVEQWLPGVA
jgi:C-terminal processing protease CtpA/Prc